MKSKYAPDCMHAPIKRAGMLREKFQEAEAERRAEKE